MKLFSFDRISPSVWFLFLYFFFFFLSFFHVSSLHVITINLPILCFSLLLKRIYTNNQDPGQETKVLMDLPHSWNKHSRYSLNILSTAYASFHALCHQAQSALLTYCKTFAWPGYYFSRINLTHHTVVP